MKKIFLCLSLALVVTMFLVAPISAGQMDKPFCKADMDKNGIVNWGDFSFLASNWMQEGSNLIGDLNNDGKVGWKDFQKFKAFWLKDTTKCWN